MKIDKIKYRGKSLILKTDKNFFKRVWEIRKFIHRGEFEVEMDSVLNAFEKAEGLSRKGGEL